MNQVNTRRSRHTNSIDVDRAEVCLLIGQAVMAVGMLLMVSVSLLVSLI